MQRKMHRLQMNDCGEHLGHRAHAAGLGRDQAHPRRGACRRRNLGERLRSQRVT